MKKTIKVSSSTPNKEQEEIPRSRRRVTYGFHLVKGKSKHPMEDSVVAESKRVKGAKLGLFAIFDGHSGQEVPNYLKADLFDNILKELNFWERTEEAIKQAYVITDEKISENANKLRRGDSTTVTAILINDDQRLVVANAGDSRAVVCGDGVAKLRSIDNEPDKEQKTTEEKGGFVTPTPGNVPRVDGQLAMARSFGDRKIKVMTSEEAVDAIKDVEDAQEAAEQLVEEAL